MHVRITYGIIVGLGVWLRPINATADQPTSKDIAAIIDKYFEEHWEANGVCPAAPVTDAAFARRAYLDALGRTPSVAELREFLDSPLPSKRAILAHHLLDAPEHSIHAATTWRRIWFPQIDTAEYRAQGPPLEAWLAHAFRQQAPYQAIVCELLCTPDVEGPSLTNAISLHTTLTAPRVLLDVGGRLPENLAAISMRAFAGLSLECAQCHDHPLSHWTQKQFWQTAAFFVNPAIQQTDTSRLRLPLPHSSRSVLATFPCGTIATIDGTVEENSGRKLLARWLCEQDNPYFAANAVNQLWKTLFGTPLVEKLENAEGDHRPLLTRLAAAFRDGNYDLDLLQEAMLLCRAYATDSRWGRTENRPSLDHFAVRQVRALTGEQLYDCLRNAAGMPRDPATDDPLSAMTEKQRFIMQFQTTNTATSGQSVLEILALQNGSFLRPLTDPAQSPTIAAVLDSPFSTLEEKIEILYLAALSRMPTPEERDSILRRLENDADGKTTSEHFADLFWVLLNSSEFCTNH